MITFFDLREKVLTPAEKRKREQVAKALERENPNMPMDKKMAIATATAKKVAEDTEPVNELSSKTLSNYSIKAANPSNQGPNKSKADKRIAGQWMADQKRRKKDGYSSSAKIAAESVQDLSNEDHQLDEISQKLKDRYIQRSQSHWQHMSAVSRDSGTDQATKDRLRAKMKKRNQGMARAFGQTKDNW